MPCLAWGHTPGRWQSCIGTPSLRSLACCALLHFSAMQPLSVWRCFPSHLWETGGTLGHRRGGAHSVPLPDGQGQRWHSMELPLGMGCPVTCPGQCSHLYLQVAPEHLRWGACTSHVNSFASSRMEVAAPGSWLPHWTAQVPSPGPPAFLGSLSLSGSQKGEPAGGNPGVSFSLSGTHTHILCLRLGSLSPGSSPQ